MEEDITKHDRSDWAIVSDPVPHPLAQSHSVTHDQETVDVLKEFLPLIRRIAGSFASKNPSALDIEDLTSAGVIGLLGSLTRYDPARATKFWTFAEYRIRGMMLDEMRSMDWIPRSVRARNEQIRQVTMDFVRTEGRVPEREEIASVIGITQEELDASAVRDTRMVSLEDPMGSQEEIFTLKDILPDEEQKDPYAACLSSETNQALADALTNLSSRQQDVVQQYYFQGSTMKEIGQRLGLTESGVCRVHAEALRKLRKELKEFDTYVNVSFNRSKSTKRRPRKKPQASQGISNNGW